MTPPPGADEPDDAQLVAGVRAGDRQAFAAVYDRYGDRLYDFCHALLRDREDAADAVADTFVRCAERIGQLRDPGSLRPWLYAIARSEALRRLRHRRRFVPDAEPELAAMADRTGVDPQRAAEQQALRDLVWRAAAGLAERDQTILTLHLRHGLDGAELGEAMGVTAQHAYVLLNRLRGQVERSLGALLVARLGRRDCAELDGVLAGWDGRFSPLIRKRVARHVDTCTVCTGRRAKVASPWALLSAVALVPAPLALRDRVVTRTSLAAPLTGPPDPPLPPHPSLPVPPPAGGGSRLRWGAAAAAVLVVLGVAATALLWPERDTEPVLADAVSSPTAPVAGAPSPLSPSSTTSAAPGTTVPVTRDGPAPVTTAPPVARPGVLAVSATEIDLGAVGTRGTVSLSNTGDLGLSWAASSADPWLTVDPAAGDLPGGGSVVLAVRADRTALPERAGDGTVRIVWSGGEVAVLVRLTADRAPPEVGRPSVSDPGCVGPNQPAGPVRVSVVASDDGGLASVVITWAQAGGPGGEAPLADRGRAWVGSAGPFPAAGTVTLRAVATDHRGTTTAGPAVRLPVPTCLR